MNVWVRIEHKKQEKIGKILPMSKKKLANFLKLGMFSFWGFYFFAGYQKSEGFVSIETKLLTCKICKYDIKHFFRHMSQCALSACISSPLVDFPLIDFSQQSRKIFQWYNQSYMPPGEPQKIMEGVIYFEKDPSTVDL